METRNQDKQPPGQTTAQPGRQPTKQPPARLVGRFEGGRMEIPEKKEYDIFVANGIKLIHSKEASDSLIKRILDADNKSDALATATLLVINRLEASAEAAGKELSLVTIAHGGNALMGEIIRLAEAAGMEELDDQTKAEAMALAISRYIDDAVKTGKITQEELVEMSDYIQNTPEGQKILKTARQASGEEAPATGAPATETTPRKPLLRQEV